MTETLGDILTVAMERQRLDDKARRDSLRTRYDKILVELALNDQDWWLNYPHATKIAALQAKKLRTQHPDVLIEINDKILELMRDEIATCVVPAMYACIRAGFVKPSEG